MDVQKLIAYRDRLIAAAQEKNRRIHELERLVKGQRKVIRNLTDRLTGLYHAPEVVRVRDRNGHLYATISDAVSRLVLEDINGAGEVLVRALRLTPEQLDDMVYNARVKDEERRRTQGRPNAIRGPGNPNSLRKRVSPSKRRRIFERDGLRCRRCGRNSDERNPLTIDHIIPLAQGGTNEDRNLQTLCLTCNLKKNEQEPIPNEPIDLDKYDVRLVPKRSPAQEIQ